MPKARSDAVGLLWEEHVYIGRSAADRSNVLKRIEAPDWKPPELFREFSHLSCAALDLETHDPELKTKGPGAHRPDTFIVGCSIGYGPDNSEYYPIAHDRGCNFADIPLFWTLLKQQADIFEGELCGANLTYDLYFLAMKHGIRFPRARLVDILITEPLIDENKLVYSLQSLSKKYLKKGKVTEQMEDVYGKDFKKLMRQTHAGHVAQYAEGDTDLPLSIISYQAVEIQAQELNNVLDLEQRLMPLLVKMKEQGVRVDIPKAEEAYEEVKRQGYDTAARLKDLTGMEVEIWSADSVGKAFDKMGIPYLRTPTGKPSFTKPWLNAHGSQLAKLIVEQRNVEKIGGTFIKNYILDGHVNGRIHCSFNQLRSDDGGTVSGRMSSSSPNLQNIPARDPVLGPLLRSMFIPEEDHDWGCTDWSQIEFRFLVHYAIIKQMIGAKEAQRMYQEDSSTDFHTLAAKITGKDRKIAKNINFGVVYGMGVRTMAYNLGCSTEEAEVVLNEFHTKLPFLKSTYDLFARMAEKDGYVTTIEGRRRHFTNWEVTLATNDGSRRLSASDFKKVPLITIPTAQPKMRSLWGFCQGALEIPGYDIVKEKYPEGLRITRTGSHKALNSVLQGSAADLMKKSMVNAWEAGVFDVLPPHLTVHDEMDVSVPRTRAGQEAFKELVYIMESTIKLEVPVMVDAKIGANWNECK